VGVGRWGLGGKKSVFYLRAFFFSPLLIMPTGPECCQEWSPEVSPEKKSKESTESPVNEENKPVEPEKVETPVLLVEEEKVQWLYIQCRQLTHHLVEFLYCSVFLFGVQFSHVPDSV
jgi:hypothetical protein